MPSTPDTTILWLHDPGAADITLVGGKAANLSALAADHPVPPGFCITAAALVELSNIQIPDGDEPDPALLPESIRMRIAEAYSVLGEQLNWPDPSVAVRSSGVDEDGAQTAFPGQFESYLNVSQADRVCAAVLACWASSRSDRVSAYRKNHGLTSGAGVAVLVQEQIPADSAAVAFSVNPISGSRDEIMINASFGLGESIVGGTVTPDTYIVDKSTLRLKTAQIGQKRRMTIRLPTGTKEVDVPRFLQSTQVFDEHQISEVAALARDLESTMGWPVDIECAYASKNLFLLQCRPVTTLTA